MNTAIFAAISAMLTGVRRRGAALSRSGIIGESGRAREVIDRPSNTTGTRQACASRYAYARRLCIRRRVNYLRGAIAVAIVMCTVSYTLGGVANAQSNPSATKPPVGLSPKKINFGKVPAGTSV